MDKHRITGAAKQVSGKVKSGVGKALGDTKLQVEGKAEQVEGKVENAVGSARDAARDTKKR